MSICSRERTYVTRQPEHVDFTGSESTQTMPKLYACKCFVVYSTKEIK